MQIDKDTLIKNRFWVLLGVFVPLILFAVIWLQTAVEGAVEEERQKIRAIRADLGKNATANLAGAKEMKLCKDKIETLEKRKLTVWREAWELQQGLMFWPDKVKDTFADLAFGKQVPDGVRTAYVDSYMEQYEAMGKFFQVQVPFKDAKGGAAKVLVKDPVQFDGGWKKVLAPVDRWKLLPPSNEEVWLAQEDVWVRHELLAALKEANTSVARFKAVGNKPGDANAGFEQTFENPYWRIELKLKPKEQNYYVSGKITNIGKKRMALGQAYFWLQVRQDQRIVLPIEGEARAVGESWDIKEAPLAEFRDPEGLFGLEQILEPHTSPVRRIDLIRTPYHSHRTYEPTYEPAKQFPHTPTASSGPQVGPGIQLRTNEPRKTPNGITAERYTDVTDQVRRLPLAMVVVVDQAHIPEVLTALANSKLRMQVTQVNWQHFGGKLKDPEQDGKEPKGKDAPKPVGGPAESKKARPTSELLVELSIYGIASLYERPTEPGEGDGPKTPAPKAPRGKR